VTDKAINPLRRRMIEDMTIRKFAPKTQYDYVQRVKHFAAFLSRSPDTASFEDVRRYQLHLAESGVGVPTLNQSVSTLRFFFKVTCIPETCRQRGSIKADQPNQPAQ
jgi:integrase/recombinase XerD